MLLAARARIAGRSIELVEADDATVWTRVIGSFDRITAGQVVQYLTANQLAAFLRAARERLVANGRVVLFDVIDPRIYALSELGLFERQSSAARTLEIAVARATQDARVAQGAQPVVLLSPACASYDQFQNYEIRGDRFRDLVRRTIASPTGAAA